MKKQTNQTIKIEVIKEEKPLMTFGEFKELMRGFSNAEFTLVFDLLLSLRKTL